jgi:hypothetical protein
MATTLLSSWNFLDFLSVVLGSPSCSAYAGLALAHFTASGLNVLHRHFDHAVVYASCGSLYFWLIMIYIGTGH